MAQSLEALRDVLIAQGNQLRQDALLARQREQELADRKEARGWAQERYNTERQDRLADDATRRERDLADIPKRLELELQSLRAKREDALAEDFRNYGMAFDPSGDRVAQLQALAMKKVQLNHDVTVATLPLEKNAEYLRNQDKFVANYGNYKSIEAEIARLSNEANADPVAEKAQALRTQLSLMSPSELKAARSIVVEPGTSPATMVQALINAELTEEVQKQLRYEHAKRIQGNQSEINKRLSELAAIRSQSPGTDFTKRIEEQSWWKGAPASADVEKGPDKKEGTPLLPPPGLPQPPPEGTTSDAPWGGPVGYALEAGKEANTRAKQFWQGLGDLTVPHLVGKEKAKSWGFDTDAPASDNFSKMGNALVRNNPMTAPIAWAYDAVTGPEEPDTPSSEQPVSIMQRLQDSARRVQANTPINASRQQMSDALQSRHLPQATPTQPVAPTGQSPFSFFNRYDSQFRFGDPMLKVQQGGGYVPPYLTNR